MDYNKTLIEYIDGTISQKDERKFLNRLAFDEQLQASMKQYLNIGSSSYGGATEIMPSKASSEKVFSELGFVLQKNAKIGFWAYLLSLLGNRWSIGILSSLFTAIGLFSFVPYFYSFEYFEESEEPRSESVVQNQTPFISPDKGKINNDITENLATVVHDTLYEKQYVYIKNQPTETIKEITKLVYDTLYLKPDFTETKRQLSESEPVNIRTEQIPENDKNQFNKTNIPLIQQPVNFLNAEGYKPIGLNVEVRGCSYWNIPYAQVQPEKYVNFNNTALGISYELTDDLKIGLDIRQETFYQEFEDDLFAYKQQPDLLTGSIFLRHSFLNMNNFRPFGQLTFGINRAGFVARPMLGIAFVPYYDVQFMLGFEYSYLNFHQDARTFNAHKLGLNYGVSYSF